MPWFNYCGRFFFLLLNPRRNSIKYLISLFAYVIVNWNGSIREKRLRKNGHLQHCSLLKLLFVLLYMVAYVSKYCIISTFTVLDNTDLYLLTCRVKVYDKFPTWKSRNIVKKYILTYNNVYLRQSNDVMKYNLRWYRDVILLISRGIV